MFTDYVSGPAVRYTYGWIFVATAIAPIFFVNLTYVFIQGAEIAKKKCKEMSIKRKKEAEKYASEIYWTDATKYANEYYGDVVYHTTRFDNDWD